MGILANLQTKALCVWFSALANNKDQMYSWIYKWYGVYVSTGKNIFVI